MLLPIITLVLFTCPKFSWFCPRCTVNVPQLKLSPIMIFELLLYPLINSFFILVFFPIFITEKIAQVIRLYGIY